jgi:hypothetical protein
MAISRAQLLKELLPGINALFGYRVRISTKTSMQKSTKPKPLSVALKKK